MTKTDFSWENADKQILSGSGTDLREVYASSEDEKYMNEQQLIYFKEKLLCWRDQLFNESCSTLNLMKDDLGERD